jgi:hypothetical protein
LLNFITSIDIEDIILEKIVQSTKKSIDKVLVSDELTDNKDKKYGKN